MATIATITWLTFHEARRRRMVVAALLLGMVFLALYGLGFWFIRGEMVAEGTPLLVMQQAYSFLLVAGLYVIHFLTVMLGIFASVDTVSGEIATHTIQTLVTKPMPRWHIILGKWLGFALMLTGYLLLLSGGVLLIVYVQSQYVPPNPFQALGLLVLEALVLLSLAILGGTRVSTLTNGVVLFMLYGVAFIGAWVEQIGALLQSQAAINVGIITSLVMPVESLWRRAASLLQIPLARSMPTPFSAASMPSVAMVVYAAIYGVLALLLAMRVFGRRDL